MKNKNDLGDCVGGYRVESKSSDLSVGDLSRDLNFARFAKARNEARNFELVYGVLHVRYDFDQFCRNLNYYQ